MVSAAAPAVPPRVTTARVPPPGASVSTMVALCAVAISLAMAQPEPGRPAGVLAAGVQPDEPAEHPLPLLLRDAGAVVGDLDHDAVRPGGGGDEHPVAGDRPRCPAGCGNPRQVLRVPGRGRSGRHGQVDADARRRGGGAQVGQQHGQVHRLAARRGPVRVGLGQHQQLGDELFQALRLPHGPARDLRPRRAVRVDRPTSSPVRIAVSGLRSSNRARRRPRNAAAGPPRPPAGPACRSSSCGPGGRSRRRCRAPGRAATGRRW